MMRVKDVDSQPLATVNGHVINAGALKREIEQLAAAVHGVAFDGLVPSQRAELKKNAITKLIREELVLQSDLADIARPSEDEIKAGMDEAQLAILVRGGDDLIAADGFQDRLRESVTRELIVHHVIDLFLQEVEVSEAEVEGIYHAELERPGKGRFVRDGRVEVSEIFLQAEPTLCPAGRSALILALTSFRERCEAGERFDALARAHSERAETRDRGGRIGWVGRDGLPGAAFDAACAAQDNGLTEVVPTPDGYVLLQITARDLSVLPLDVVRDEIREELRDARARAAFRAWVAQMMNEADIRVGATW